MNPKDIEQTRLKSPTRKGRKPLICGLRFREKVRRVQKKAPRRFLPHTRLSWSLSIVLVLLLGTTAVFAVNSLIHNALQIDPGLAYADMQKSGQEVNQTQTASGFTVP